MTFDEYILLALKQRRTDPRAYSKLLEEHNPRLLRMAEMKGLSPKRDRDAFVNFLMDNWDLNNELQEAIQDCPADIAYYPGQKSLSFTGAEVYVHITEDDGKVLVECSWYDQMESPVVLRYVLGEEPTVSYEEI